VSPFSSELGCKIHYGGAKLGCPIQFLSGSEYGRGRDRSAGGAPADPARARDRQRIVAAAAELMFDNGVAETTLEDIRAAASPDAGR